MTMLKMQRRRVLAGGAAAFGAFVYPGVPARARSRMTYDLAPVEVADGIWMIEGKTESFDRDNGGHICNIALLEGSDGAVVIDSGSTLRLGEQIRAFANQRLGGVAALVNTHHHPDHWFGNAAFADRPSFAMGQTIALCAQYADGYADGLYAILGPWMQETKPIPAVSEIAPGSQLVGGRRLTVIPGSGHCEADLALIDEHTGTLIAGDLLFLNRAPTFPDADLEAWHASLDMLAPLPVSGVIPGHGPFQRSSTALLQTRAYLRSFEARLTRAAQSGLTPVEAMAAGPDPEFAHLGANPAEYHRSVVQRWTAFERDALPLVSDV